MIDEEITTQDENVLSDNNSGSSVGILRSVMAQEVISRKSGFLENWSLLIFLGILLLILGGTWFVPYPDSIVCSATLKAENNPKEIVANQEGSLLKFFVRNNQLLKKNDAIALLESTADYIEVSELSKETDSIISFLTQNKLQKIGSTINVNFNHLGELQAGYQQFLVAADDFNNYISNKSNLVKARSGHIIDRQKIAFQQQLQSLKSQIGTWQNKYLLRAPMSGKFIMSSNVNENDYLRAGASLGCIMPVNDRYFMEAIVPQSNFGKLDTGLHVKIHFDAYPYEEWGALDGTLNYISNTSSASGFLAVIKLNHGLTTDNQKKLVFRSGLRAQAIIITKDMRLLQKFYYGFIKSTFSNN